jgi:hypothetical protein
MNAIEIMNVIDIYLKFQWSFPMKNKSADLVCHTLQKLILQEGSPEFIGSARWLRSRGSFTGTIKQRKERVHIMNVIDIYSKFQWSFPMKNKSADLVCHTLQKLILQEGSPEIIGADNGTEFNHFDQLAERFSIDIRHGQPYRSNTQGGIERVNGTTRDSIFNYLQDKNAKRWVDVLPMLVYTYNTTRHSSTKMTPFQVHRRRDEVFKMDRFVKANLEKTAQEMIRRFAKLPAKNVRPKAVAEPLTVGDNVRISTQSQIEVRKDGDIKIKSKLKKRLLTTIV